MKKEKSELNRIVVFTENYAKGGGNRYLVDLINSFDVDEHEILVFSNSGGIYSEDICRLNKPVKFKSIFFITRALFFNWIKFPIHQKNKFLRRFISIPLVLLEPLFLFFNILSFLILCFLMKPDRVIACNGGYPAAKSCCAMIIAARLFKIPTVLSIVSMPASRNKFLYFFEKALDIMLWGSTDVVIVNAKAISEALSIRRDMPINKSYVIHNGLESLAPINPMLDDGDLIEKGDFVIGVVARLDKEKGILFLFEAFISMLEKHPNLKLILVGYGDIFDEIALRIAQLGLQNRIKLPGYLVGDISALLPRFDIYVLPSLWEGLPYSILEALRSGCVVVATNVGGISEAILDRFDGMLIEPASSLAIIRALDELINDAELRAKLSTNAKIKFESNFTLAGMEVRVREVFALTKK